MNKVYLVFLLSIILSGCLLEGDDGNVGLQGLAGISCWDLNEDGVKSFPEEDTNVDGEINVLDCRASQPIAVPTAHSIIVDPSAESIIHEHARVSNTTYDAAPKRIGIYSGDLDDYSIAQAANDWTLLDTLVTDPIDDSCGLWKWHQVDASGPIKILANDGIAGPVSHHAAVSVDSSGNTHLGSEACRLSCLSDSQCVGAFFAGEKDAFSNTVSCRRVYKSDIDLTESFEFQAFETFNRSFLVANMATVGATSSGLISVCTP